MIVITQDHDYESTNIRNVWEVNSNNPEQDYKDFIIRFAQNNFQIEINPHWLNIMNHKDHHPNLSEAEYKEKVNQWGEFLRRWTIENYLEKILHANKIEYLIFKF